MRDGKLTRINHSGNPSADFGKRIVYLRDLLRVLVARDMKLRYKRSTLGFAWSLLNPLAQMLVFTFVFSNVLPLNIPNYSSFLFSGLLVWNWFNTSLFQATDAIVGNRELIRRPGFPIAILPVVTITSQMLHFILALPVLFIFLALNGIYPQAAVVMLPVLIALQFVFTLSLAYLAATFHVSFRDTQYLLGIVLLLGFYVTPIFYDASVIPAQYLAIYSINPMYVFIQNFRMILLYGKFPYLIPLAVMGLISLILLFFSYRIFKSASTRFAEEL